MCPNDWFGFNIYCTASRMETRTSSRTNEDILAPLWGRPCSPARISSINSWHTFLCDFTFFISPPWDSICWRKVCHVYTFSLLRIYVRCLTYICSVPHIYTFWPHRIYAAGGYISPAADVACRRRRQSYNLHRLTLSLFVTICYFSLRFLAN